MKEEAKASAEQIISGHFRATELRPYGQLIREIAGSLEAAYNVGFFEGRQVGLRQGRERGYFERFFNETKDTMAPITTMGHNVPFLLETQTEQRFGSMFVPRFNGERQSANLLWTLANAVMVDDETTFFDEWKSTEGTTMQPRLLIVGGFLVADNFVADTRSRAWRKYVESHEEEEPQEGPKPDDSNKS